MYLHLSPMYILLGIHRLREAGLAWGLMDNLDERPLSIDEIHKFCKMLFLGENVQGSAELPHPRNWMTFMQGLTQVMKNHKPIWNPVSKRQSPWINLSKLHSLYGRAQGGGPSGTSKARGSSIASAASTNNHQSLQQILKRWSHESPNYHKLHPLEHLLVTIPDIFPPTNSRVEPHEYFAKWKTFSKDAFTGSGEELNELLKRGS